MVDQRLMANHEWRLWITAPDLMARQPTLGGGAAFVMLGRESASLLAPYQNHDNALGPDGPYQGRAGTLQLDIALVGHQPQITHLGRVAGECFRSIVGQSPGLPEPECRRRLRPVTVPR